MVGLKVCSNGATVVKEGYEAEGWRGNDKKRRAEVKIGQVLRDCAVKSKGKVEKAEKGNYG